MAAEHEHNPAQAGAGFYQDPSVGHEPSDINARGIIGFAAGLALCILLVCLVLYGMFSLLRRGFTSPPVNVNALVGTREPVAASEAAAAQTFPEPRLQVDYFADLARVRSDWNQRLHTYGWLDPKDRVVHIPIDRAMQLVLQRGLPTRAPGLPATAAAAATGKRPAAGKEAQVSE